MPHQTPRATHRSTTHRYKGVRPRVRPRPWDRSRFRVRPSVVSPTEHQMLTSKNCGRCREGARPGCGQTGTGNRWLRREHGENGDHQWEHKHRSEPSKSGKHLLHPNGPSIYCGFLVQFFHQLNNTLTWALGEPSELRSSLKLTTGIQ